MNFDDSEGHFVVSDRVGVLLDLNNGSMRFFKNGHYHGRGFPAGAHMRPWGGAFWEARRVSMSLVSWLR